MRNIIIAIAMGFVIAVILCWIGINFISTHPDCCFLKPGGAKLATSKVIRYINVDDLLAEKAKRRLKEMKEEEERKKNGSYVFAHSEVIL